MSKSDRAIIFLSLVVCLAVLSPRLSAQQFGFYCPTRADFGLKEPAKQLVELPSKTYDDQQGKFAHIRGEPTAWIRQFGPDGVLNTSQVGLYEGKDQISVSATYTREYGPGRLLRLVSETDIGGLIASVKYQQKKEGDWVLLLPALTTNKPDATDLYPYKYRIKDDGGRVVEILGNKDQKLEEVRYNSSGLKESAVHYTVPLGWNKYADEIMEFNGDGQIVRDAVGTERESRYEYDSRGLLIRLVQTSTGSVHPREFSYEYKLDERGNWVEKTEYLVTAEGRQPFTQNYRRITYYDP